MSIKQELNALCYSTAVRTWVNSVQKHLCMDKNDVFILNWAQLDNVIGKTVNIKRQNLVLTQK